MADLIDIAIKELGYSAPESNTKFGKWYGMQGPWCAMFVSWCANRAGVGTGTVPKFAYVPSGISWYKNKGRYKSRGAYTPQRNDIVFFGGGSHTGIVERVSGSTLHTIEGNTTNSVARRQYSLASSYVTGYGQVGKFISGGSRENTGSSSSKSQEITKTVVKSVTGKPGGMRKFVKIDVPGAPLCELYMRNDGKTYQPVVEEGIVWETERKGVPGKLTFTVFDDGELKFSYGSAVTFKYNKQNVFYGFVFKVTPRPDGLTDIVAYDQLRYFKNRHTYVYKNKRLDQLVKMIADDFQLRAGKLTNTKKVLSRVEDNNSLFDIIANATDDTVLATGKLFVLYDDFGYLQLKNISEMKLTHLIDEDTAQSYDYTASIDDNSYSKVVVYYDNDGTREFHVANSKKYQEGWGILQLTEKAGSKATAKQQAKLLLDMYSKPTRNLTVTGALGNTKARAGALIPVMLKLRDVNLSKYMMISKAVHTFKEGEYTMDLTLVGNSFVE